MEAVVVAMLIAVTLGLAGLAVRGAALLLAARD